MFSQTILVGRLGDDPKLNYTKNEKAVANFSIATSKKYKDSDGDWQEKTNWHRVVVWGGSAEAVEKYLGKGSLVAVIGESQTRKYEDSDGNDKYITEVVVSGFDGTKVIFLDSKSSDDESERKSSKSSKRDKEEKSSKSSSKRDKEERATKGTEIDDEDIPF